CVISLTLPISFLFFILTLHAALPTLDVDCLLQHEHADVCDVLTHLERLRIVVALCRAEEDRPQPAIEQQCVIERLVEAVPVRLEDRKSTRLNSSHGKISYAGFCLK